MQPPPENSLLIFAGSADITERNLRRQMSNFLPITLKVDRPVIQAAIPDDYEGLHKVRAWLEAEFADDFDEADELPEFIGTLENTADVYLIVLWGSGGDEPTEQLVDMAARRGITVLDLTDGLETLELGHHAPPEDKTEPEAGTSGRPRRRTRPAPQDDSETREDTPAESPQESAVQLREITVNPDMMLIGLLGRAFQAAADVFLNHLAATPAVRLADEPAASGAEETRPEPGEETRAWYQNPKNRAEYEFKKNRGRIPTAMKTWNIVFLTRAQEAELGLKVPGGQ